jgi:hypothetical protein
MHSPDRYEGPIHLVYLHGSILRHNPPSITDELDKLAKRNIAVLCGYLKCRDVTTIGYNGWNDGLMAVLRRCHSSPHNLYWCDIHSQPAPHVATFLGERADGAVYCPLG